MTGFGRGTHTAAGWLAGVEAASINRKQAEIVVNLPRSLQSLESRVRQAVVPHVSRGRVQISIRLERPEGSETGQIRINGTLVGGLVGLSWLPALSAIAVGTLLVLAILIAWAGFARQDLPAKVLLAIPVYLLWKIPVYLKFVKGPESSWVRTARDTVDS